MTERMTDQALTPSLERLRRDLEIQDGGGMAYTCQDTVATVVVQAEDLRFALHRLKVSEGESSTSIEGGVSLGGHYLTGKAEAIRAVMEWHQSHITIDEVRRQCRHAREAWGKAEAKVQAAEAKLSALKEAVERAEARERAVVAAMGEAAWKWAVTDLALDPDEHDSRALARRIAEAVKAALSSQGEKEQ